MAVVDLPQSRDHSLTPPHPDHHQEKKKKEKKIEGTGKARDAKPWQQGGASKKDNRAGNLVNTVNRSKFFLSFKWKKSERRKREYMPAN